MFESPLQRAIRLKSQPARDRQPRSERKKMKKSIASVCLCFLLSCTAFAASSREDLQDRVDAAKTVLEQHQTAFFLLHPLVLQYDDSGSKNDSIYLKLHFKRTGRNKRAYKVDISYRSGIDQQTYLQEFTVD